MLPAHVAVKTPQSTQKKGETVADRIDGHAHYWLYEQRLEPICAVSGRRKCFRLGYGGSLYSFSREIIYKHIYLKKEKIKYDTKIQDVLK
jgi:hypothetical protein